MDKTKPTNALAGLWDISQRAAEEAKAKEEAEKRQRAIWQAQLLRRLRRIKTSAERWEKDDLVDNYAWMLLLALELRKSRRTIEETGRLSQQIAERWRLKTEEMEAFAKEQFGKNYRFHLDRKKGAERKKANDPKQADKANAKRLWQDWQEGRAMHKSGAAFARFVVDNTGIENPETVERWMRAWRRERVD